MSHEEEDESYKQFEIKEGTIFLIELTPEIYAPVHELGGTCQLFEILKSINDLMSEMIITSCHNGIGVYFYHCGRTGSKFKKKSGINKVFRLNDLNASNMKTLNDLITDGEEQFRLTYPPGSVNDVPVVLNTVLNEFQSKTYNYKKLIWITNNDDPYQTVDSKKSIRSFINDFDQFRINVIPIFLGDDLFDLSKYQEIFINTNYLNNKKRKREEDLDDDGYEEFDEYANSKITDLIFDGVSADTRKFNNTTVSTQIRSSILRLREIKRIQFSCNLVLSDGPGVGGKLGCSVRGYQLFNYEKIKSSRNVYNQGENLKIVYNDSTRVLETSKEPVIEDSEAIRTGYELSDTPKETVIHFDNKTLAFMKNYAFDHRSESPDDDDEEEEVADSFEEMEDLNSFTAPPYLKLIGFRDTLKFKPFLNYGTSIFVTADLSNGLTSNSHGGYLNSFGTFASLYQSCYKLQKMMVVFGCSKRNSKPNLYVMYPSRLMAGFELPEGFIMFKLPWLDDVRSLPEYVMAGSPTGPAAGVSALSQLFLLAIGKLQWQYNPREFPNPNINYFYKVIKHELLQIELKQEHQSLLENDESYNRLQHFNQSVCKIEEIAAINKLLNQYGNLETIKRVNQENSGKALVKLTELAVLTAWKQDNWGHFNNTQLRQFIAKYPNQIKSATRKQDMINNIIDFLKKKV